MKPDEPDEPDEMVRRIVNARGYLVLGRVSCEFKRRIINIVRSNRNDDGRYYLPQPFMVMEQTTEEDWLQQRKFINDMGIETENQYYPLYYRARTE